MGRSRGKLYDAFPTKAGAKAAAADINASAGAGCATSRKLKTPQDGGRLKFGVYVKRSCKI